MYGRIFAILGVALGAALVPRLGAAHPMGNFSVSHYSAIRVSKEAIEVKYILDLAEIPTFLEMQENGIAPDSDSSATRAFLRRKTTQLRDGLLLRIGGQRRPLEAAASEIIFPPGAGGLPTMKIAVRFTANLGADAAGAERVLEYRDDNFPGRAGWKEIVARAEREVNLLESSAPAADRSRELTDYPSNLLDSPPQQLEARIRFAMATAAPAEKNSLALAKPARAITPSARLSTQAINARPTTSGSEPPRLSPNRQATPRNSFTEIMATKELGWEIVLAALAVAVALGAFHALEPGHGKTLVAAYLVGSRGTFKQALLLGLIVTASHTAGVYLLGAATLYASQYIVPERLYPWLALASGLMIAALGLTLLARRISADDHSRNHAHHHHHHHDHDRDHAHLHHHHETTQNVSLKQLIALGVSGGIVPCPAALVVLLSAVSLHRIGFGLLLIVAFSVGLAAVLIAVGMLMVYARRFMARFRGDGMVVTRWLPVTSSAFIALFGLGLTWQALVSAGFIRL
jgi:ABC-type nickel/cobalt efflux system permease component RcnA